jgi:hypothetical protein
MGTVPPGALEKARLRKEAEGRRNAAQPLPEGEKCERIEGGFSCTGIEETLREEAAAVRVGAVPPPGSHPSPEDAETLARLQACKLGRRRWSLFRKREGEPSGWQVGDGEGWTDEECERVQVVELLGAPTGEEERLGKSGTGKKPLPDAEGKKP